MKKKVKQYGQQVQQGEKDRRRVLKDFSKMLDDQVMPRDRCYAKPLLHSPWSALIADFSFSVDI